MSLKDDLLKHQIFLQRLGAKHAQDITDTLDEAIVSAIKFVNKQQRGLNRNELRYLHTNIISILHSLIDSQMALLLDTAVYEAKFVAKLLKRYGFVDEPIVPSRQDLDKALETKKMSAVSGENKKTFEFVYAQFTNTKASEIILKVGDTSLQENQEDVVDDIAAALIGLGVGLFAAQAMTLATTTTTQAASLVRQNVYVENEIPLLDWVTELDSDVCEDCEALGAGGPYLATDSDIPPEHWNCRCVLVPVRE